MAQYRRSAIGVAGGIYCRIRQFSVTRSTNEKGPAADGRALNDFEKTA